MDCVSVPAFVKVYRKSETGKMVAFAVVVVMLAVGIVGGLAAGRYAVALGLLPLLLAAQASRRAGSTSENRLVQASFTLSGVHLMVFLPGTRLFNGEYIDQQYVCSCDCIDQVGVDAQGLFTLRARQLDSVACKGALVVERKPEQFAEVTLTIERSAIPRLEGFLRSCERSTPANA